MDQQIDIRDLTLAELFNLWPGRIKGELQRRARAVGRPIERLGDYLGAADFHAKPRSGELLRDLEKPQWGRVDHSLDYMLTGRKQMAKEMRELGTHPNLLYFQAEDLGANRPAAWALFIKPARRNSPEWAVNHAGLLWAVDQEQAGYVVTVYFITKAEHVVFWESPIWLHRRAGVTLHGVNGMGDYHYVVSPAEAYEG